MQATELAVRNASSPGTWPMQTKAYTGMVVLGCTDDDDNEEKVGPRACSILVTYDRLANGNEGPPGPWGKVDAVFSMVVTLTPGV